MKPNDNSEIFLDALISSIQTHLTTVGGLYITTAFYTPAPLLMPAIKFWTGYTIPPAGQSNPNNAVNEESPPSQQFEEASTFSPEEAAIANAASEKGYSGMAATGIALSAGQLIKSGGASVSSVISSLKPSPRPPGDAKEPTPSVPGEKITECGDVKLPTPNEKLVEAMKIFGIDTPIRRAHFLAQCAHESGGFKWVREFASGKAYEGRKDLGNTQEGDGVRYKGRGYIQLTGRANYTKFRGSVSKDVVSEPILVEQDYVAQSAAWFWKINNFNSFSNDDSVETLKKVTKRVNGGYNGYEDRKKYFCGYWKKLQEDPTLYT